jgi:hypothetical protein
MTVKARPRPGGEEMGGQSRAQAELGGRGNPKGLVPVVDGSVVVVVVVNDVVVVVDGLGLVVVGAVMDEALGCGRVGSGDDVGLGTRLDHDVVVEMPVASPVGASVRLPPTAAGPRLGAVVVGPATPTPESIVSGPTPTA